MMYKVTDYRTVRDRLSNSLDKKIVKLLEEGWTLYGDQIVIVYTNREDAEYSQVMIKSDKLAMPYDPMGEQE